MELLASLGTREPLAQLVRQDLADIPVTAALVSVDILAILELPALLVHLDLAVTLALLAQQELLDSVVIAEPMVRLAHLVLAVIQVIAVLVSAAIQGTLVTLARLVLLPL